MIVNIYKTACKSLAICSMAIALTACNDYLDTIPSKGRERGAKQR